MEDIAVIGIGCRFPGANNIEEYWRVLKNGENHIIDIPKERWNNEAFYSKNKDEAGKSYVKKAGFISGHDEFDNKLFGISDSEAVNIDPQQRQVLECTHMALEDAGITRDNLKGTETGVFMGVMNDDYKGLSSFDHEGDTNYSATGMSTTIISARVSYVYDIRGPCMVVDTACSSSMVAIHLGCQAIRSGDCKMAICGGVSSILTADQFITLCKARILSPSGQCQSFCDTADGYGRGEGCGIVIIKSYTQAMQDKNKIWGIVKTGSNQDGRAAQPITAPSAQQQEELLKKLYNQYRIEPNSLQYIEAHGTGTPIGDPTEINAIGKFIKSYKSKIPPDKQDKTNSFRDRRQEILSLQNKADAVGDSPLSAEDDKTHKPILIGSVKSNIGHLESAAGVAALIKVLLMMKHEKFVPSLHVKRDKSNINKKIALDTYGLDISLEYSAWKPNANGERICCVNCFGFGGSNTHAIVIQNKQRASSKQTSTDGDSGEQYRIVCLSGLNKSALIRNMEDFSKELATGHYDTKDISFTSIYHRDHFAYRTLLFLKTDDDFQKQVLQKMSNVERMETEKKTKIVFVFCGVGTTWKGMCQEMMKTQRVFRKTVAVIDENLQPLTGWSITEKFLNDTDYSDPFLNHIAIFCTQVALFEHWKSWGIYPQAVVGQSVGEVAASYASGALSLADAVQVIYHRSQILAGMTGGKMMVAGNVAVRTLENICQKLNNRVTVAVYNSPISCTLSGDADAIDEVKAILEDMNQKEYADVMIRPLSVQCAYHSHHMEPCIEEIQSKLILNKKRNITTDHFSTVSGELAENEEFQSGKYWADNIRKPVLFMKALVRSADENAQNVFIEIGPRPVLRAHLSHIMGSKLKGISLPSMNSQKESEIILTSLNTLFELGINISWRNIVPEEGNIVSVPRYVFQKTKFLHIPSGKQALLRGTIKGHSDSHLYVRQNIDGNSQFIIHLDKTVSPFVYDHFLFNAVLVPGATYVEAAFEIGHQKSSLSVYEIGVAIEFVNTFMPVNDKQCLMDVEVENKGPDNFQFVVRKDGKILSRGNIFPRTKYDRKQLNISSIISRCQIYRKKEDSYKCLEKLNFRYGESLNVIEQSWSSRNECVVEFTLPETVLRHRKLTHMHPSIIDGMFQTFGILSSAGVETPTLPKGLGSIVINGTPQRKMYGYSRLVQTTAIGNHYNSLLLSFDGHVLAEIYDFYTKAMRDTVDTPSNAVYSSVWQEVQLPSLRETVSMESAHLTVISSKRFMSCFKAADNLRVEYLDIKSGFTEESLNCLSVLQSIVYAPFFHIHQLSGDGPLIFECVKKSFLHLSLLISSLRALNKDIPVFVVTEATAGTSKQEGSPNVCGAELWGMVRSAVSEGAYSNLTLIDMTITDENFATLKEVLESNIKGYNEFLIENGKCHGSKVIDESDRCMPSRREINAAFSEDMILKSSSPMKITGPFFDIKECSSTTGTKSECKIQLKTICHHSPSVFPVANPLTDEEMLSWQDDDAGYPVICIEGKGRRHVKSYCKDNKGAEVVFCCPVYASAIVSVPEHCVFDLKSLPVYFPGMLSVGLIVWNILDVCRTSRKICVIVDDDSKYLVQLMKHFVSDMAVSVHITTKGSMHELSTNTMQDIRTLIAFAKLTSTHFDTITEVFPSLQNIVSIEEYFTKKQKVLIRMQNQGILFTILKTEDMLTVAKLKVTLPKVCSSFRKMNNKNDYLHEKLPDEENENLKQKDILHLPYTEFSLYQEKEMENFPLKVAQKDLFRKNGCYVLVGGLTGLGWELLQFMAEIGVKYIATFSRRLPTKERENEMEQVRKMYGCQVIHLPVDITNLGELTNTFVKLKNLIGRDVDIKGIFHGGGATRDTLLRNMSETDLEIVLLPKVLGTWNLHVATLGMQLDFFVMHSSIVSILGNQGQCNYAAGNSFQDSFAYYRRSHGLSGQSINWSALSVGMATENKVLEKYLSSQGLYYLTKEDIRQCIMQALMTDQIQIIFGKFDWQKMKENPVVKMNPSRFFEIMKRYPHSEHKLKVSDKNVDIDDFRQDPSSQKHLIYEVVKSNIAETFVVDENTLTESTKILSLGIESMAAMSFTNAIFDLTKVRIPIGTIFDESTTIEFLTTFIVTRMQKKYVSACSKMDEGNTRAKEYLKGDITFMQKTLLDDFVKHPFSRNIMRQVDFEITGLRIQKSDMKVVLKHLTMINPDLRRMYTIEKDGTYHPVLLETHKVEIDLEEVEFNSICGKPAVDERDRVRMDITKELPIRVKIAFGKETTRVRMFVHAILGDLLGITNLFREMGDIFKCHLQHKALPVKDFTMEPADAVRACIMPQIDELRSYWKSTFRDEIHPFTFSNDINDELEERYWENTSRCLPSALVDRMMDFMHSQGLSMYHLIVSVYMVLLREKTGRNVIPLVTFADMRSHVPQLQSVLQSCSNAVPIIGNLRQMGQVASFLKRNADKLNEITQHSAYPYELIEQEMQSEQLQAHIGRHRIIMENMTALTNHFEQESFEIKIGDVFYKRHVYETTFHAEYDMKQKIVSLQFGFNTKAITVEEAVGILGRMQELILQFVQAPQKEIKEILEASDGTQLNDDSGPRKRSFRHKGTIDKSKDIIRHRIDSDIGHEENSSLQDYQEVILTERFTKQTTQGWEHSIQLKLAKQVSACGNGEVLVSWGRGKKERIVKGRDISEVEVKKINGMFYILVETLSRVFIFKDASLSKVTGWVGKFRQVNEEIKHFNKQQMLCQQ